MHGRYVEEEMDPYQELELAEEFYIRTMELGRDIPKDEMSQDMYQASLDEARCVLDEARKKVAELEAQQTDQTLECERL